MIKQPLDTIAYHVQPGDSLYKIIKRYYGVVSPQTRQGIIEQIQRDNKKVTNPNHIVPNQLLLIDIPRQYCAAPTEQRNTPILNIDKTELQSLQTHWNSASPKERSLLSQIAPTMLGVGSASLIAINTSFKTNAPQLQSLVKLYEDYKANKLTKGQYDYRRAKLIKVFEKKLGFLKNITSRRRNQRQILRISRSKGKKPTGNITRHMQRMKRIARHASNGAALLTVASVGLACSEIASTNDTLQKNHIFVESLGSVAGGGIYGIGVAIIFLGSPVGWVAALAIGAGSFAASVGGGQAFKMLYDEHANKEDYVSKLKVSSLCG